MALNMYVLLTDNVTGFKLGIYNKEYWIYTPTTDWCKFNTPPYDSAKAKAKFNAICRNHEIDEMKRKNELLVG